MVFTTTDAGCIAVPGLVDIHVHLRDPGQEYKETIETGTAAAAHGGFTGICSMPNPIPTTDNAATIDYVLDRARSAGHCRVYPSGACTMGLKGESLAEIGDMAAHGAVAFCDEVDSLSYISTLTVTLVAARLTSSAVVMVPSSSQ